MFYWQAIFYSFLPATYGTGRLASLTVSLVAAIFVYLISRELQEKRFAALIAFASYLFSRWLLFPAIAARPDMLCSTLGLAAVYLTLKWKETRKNFWLVLSGLAIGAGGLTHPFAIVYAIQLGIYVAVVARGRNRILLPLQLAGLSLLVFSLWLMLILQAPEVFRVQIKNQFLTPQEHGLLSRILIPWDSLYYHWLDEQGMFHHIGPIQFFLGFGSLVAISSWSLYSVKGDRLRTLSILGWSSIFIISVIVGPHHPVIGYWSYSAAFMSIALGIVIERMSRLASQNLRINHRIPQLICGGTLAVLLTPGSGLRTLAVTLQHWDETNYNSPQFAQNVMKSLPTNARLAVDTQFVFDFLASERSVVLAQSNPMYFRMNQAPVDYYIISRYGIRSDVLAGLPVVCTANFGTESDPFACYCEVHQSTDSDHKAKLKSAPQAPPTLLPD